MISSDFILNHFSAGTLTIVKGAPAVGKTAFAISVALRLAQSTRRVLYFSLEMSQSRLVDRMKLQIEEDELQVLKSRIDIDDTLQISLDQIRSKLERTSVDYVLVDYIQLLSPSSLATSRKEELISILQDLRLMAEEFHVAIVGLFQLPKCFGMGESHNDLNNSDSDDDAAVDIPGINVGLIDRDGKYTSVASPFSS
ncbi:DnaB-like helicase C-terminal domain-containing protein [uncultured Porphyromonas sp.]|uniref:DnaB-like helicase C-terminal domain-containing protein n=1 Tax=uncultured Porphyromonas sp. TaxID=159274 RepID=UPI0026219A05|nr:DnaB-like helicase C-terminal domain-containing protein [uncultured Porphyromonas sp.]